MDPRAPEPIQPPDQLSAQQQIAIDQGSSQDAAACAFDLRRSLEPQPERHAQAMAESVEHAVERTERFVRRRHDRISSLDRELLLHWIDEADERLRALRVATPVVGRLLRDLSQAGDPLFPADWLTRVIDVQQAVVDTEQFLTTRRAQAMSTTERRGLDAALERARAFLSIVQG